MVDRPSSRNQVATRESRKFEHKRINQQDARKEGIEVAKNGLIYRKEVDWNTVFKKKTFELKLFFYCVDDL
ncbi:hypothetical protein CW304_02665 [Bacillus sp. UFRGS-B20]|nr:hypothetical protein CW304_02665 [Bacillus sp. UFRGS-B20]